MTAMPASQPPHFPLGDIAVTPPGVVSTPYARASLFGTSWDWDGQWSQVTQTPWWAIVLGVMFCWSCIGIGFFFIRTTKIVGSVNVQVTGNGLSHTTIIPITSEQQGMWVQQMVNWFNHMSSQGVWG